MFLIIVLLLKNIYLEFNIKDNYEYIIRNFAIIKFLLKVAHLKINNLDKYN